MSTAREQAQKAASKARQDLLHREGWRNPSRIGEVSADAASDVWAPLLRRALDIAESAIRAHGQDPAEYLAELQEALPLDGS